MAMTARLAPAYRRSADMAELRRRAEESLGKLSEEERRAMQRCADANKLIHELELNRAELELQNEDLRQARDTLHASYTELYDHAPVGYVTFDKLGVIRRANLTAVRMLGRERPQLIGKLFAQLVDSACRDRFRVFMKRLSSAEGKQSCTLTLLTSDGVRVYTLVDAAAFRDGYRAVIMDMTSAQQSELARRHSDERFDLAVEATQIGVWELDVASGELFWTPECTTIFGVNHLVLKLDALKAIVHRDDRERFTAFLEGCRHAKAPRTLEYRIVGPHGAIAWIHSVCKLQYAIDGEPSRLVGTAKDITLPKRREEELCKALFEKEVLLRAVEQMREVRKRAGETPCAESRRPM